MIDAARNLIVCHRCQYHGPLIGHVILCTIGGQSIISHAAADECPKDLFPRGEAIAAVAPPASAATEASAWGPRLWALLHTSEGSPEFLGRFAAMLPAQCGCRREWADVLAMLPPRYGDEWFGWTVDAHNAINWLLGKRQMTHDEARARWPAIAGSTAR